MTDTEDLSCRVGDHAHRAVHWFLASILVGAFAVRLAVVILFPAGLAEDRDGYLALGESLASGRGFVRTDTGEPTAYRPPLYPAMIAAWRMFGGGDVALGIVQALLGTVTVFLTWRLSRRYLGDALGLLPAAIVTVDPLLARYTAFAMTETLFTALTTALLATATRPPPWSRQRALLVGLLVGLTALCRPTIWAWAAMMMAWTAITTLVMARSLCDVSSGRRFLSNRMYTLGWIVVAIAAVVSPWAIRNWLTLGWPIVTTTHGGYTLLLANNPVVYREEVNQPWGVTWEQAPPGRRQEDWYAAVLTEMRRDLGPNADELATDRWMSRRAQDHIRDEPPTFWRACLLRVRRLWNIAPLGPATVGIPRAVATAVGWFYVVLFALAVVGTARVACGHVMRRSETSTSPSRGATNGPESGTTSKSTREAPSWAPLFLFLASFTVVHAVYWSNARMRAPLTPVVALLAAAVANRRWHSAQKDLVKDRTPAAALSSRGAEADTARPHNSPDQSEPGARCGLP